MVAKQPDKFIHAHRCVLGLYPCCLARLAWLYSVDAKYADKLACFTCVSRRRAGVTFADG